MHVRWSWRPEPARRPRVRPGGAGARPTPPHLAPWLLLAAGLHSLLLLWVGTAPGGGAPATAAPWGPLTLRLFDTPARGSTAPDGPPPQAPNRAGRSDAPTAAPTVPLTRPRSAEPTQRPPTPPTPPTLADQPSPVAPTPDPAAEPAPQPQATLPVPAAERAPEPRLKSKQLISRR